eukprot:12768389-Prorocentrum_lima.AAC.1
MRQRLVRPRGTGDHRPAVGIHHGLKEEGIATREVRKVGERRAKEVLHVGGHGVAQRVENRLQELGEVARMLIGQEHHQD